MRLLICTQAVDEKDPVLGFFVAWIGRFAHECERVTVVTLREGSHALPSNVQIHVLGRGKFRRAAQLLTLSYRHRTGYDAVFVHMNPEYLVVAGWLWKMLGKRIGLWYVHKSANIRLRIARRFVDAIFTASDTTFPIQDRRIVVTGHGIDVEASSGARIVHDGFRIATIGRIAPSKQTRLIAEAVCAVATSRPVCLSIYGRPVTPQESAYERDLTEWLQEHDTQGIVTMHGIIAHVDVPEGLRGVDLFVNMGTTGGIDKAVLEAMAAGVPTISSSPAHAPMLAKYGVALTPVPDVRKIAESIITIMDMPPEARRDLGMKLRSEVVSHHSLSSLITRITWILSRNR